MSPAEPGAETVAIPSISRRLSPASRTAFTAASMCSASVEWPGSLPTWSVSAAPAMMTRGPPFTGRLPARPEPQPE